MNKYHIALVISLLILLISCENKYSDGIVVSGFPKSFQLTAISNISSEDNSTIIKLEVSGKMAEIVITPSIEKILNPEPDSIKVDKVYRPTGVSTFISFHKEGVLSIIIADNATERDKVLDLFTIAPGKIISNKDTNNISPSNRTKTTITLSSEKEKIQLNPGELFRFSKTNIIWDYYYSLATVPNSNITGSKNISKDIQPLTVDWILIRKKSP